MDWYKKKNIQVGFHDYKKEGIAKDKLTAWSKQVGWGVLLNKKSTTWRSLSPEQQDEITNEQSAIRLMMEYTSIIKRPVVEMNDKLIVGFNETYFTKP